VLREALISENNQAGNYFLNEIAYEAKAILILIKKEPQWVPLDTLLN